MVYRYTKLAMRPLAVGSVAGSVYAADSHGVNVACPGQHTKVTLLQAVMATKKIEGKR